MMALPKELTQQLNQQIADYKEEQKMRYVTTFERGGIEKGIKLGIQQGAVQNQRENLLGVLHLRFPNVSLPTFMVEQVNSIDDAALLKKLFNLSVLVDSMPKFEQELARLTNA